MADAGWMERRCVKGWERKKKAELATLLTLQLSTLAVLAKILRLIF
jgi:hypothetical protein